MGFTDKLKNAVQDTASYGAEKADNAGYSLKIADKKNEIGKIEKDIGSAIYAKYSEGGSDLPEDVAKLCEKIKALMDEIEDLEKQKQDNSDKAKAERDSRKNQ